MKTNKYSKIQIIIIKSSQIRQKIVKTSKKRIALLYEEKIIIQPFKDKYLTHYTQKERKPTKNNIKLTGIIFIHKF